MGLLTLKVRGLSPSDCKLNQKFGPKGHKSTEGLFKLKEWGRGHRRRSGQEHRSWEWWKQGVEEACASVCEA